MATIDDSIKAASEQVAKAVQESKVFIDELKSATNWYGNWSQGDINLSRITSNDTITLENVSLPTPSIPAIFWEEELYQTPILDEAKKIILFDLVNGGYGLDPRDEQALWERAKDRESQNADNSIQDFQRSIAARGFSMPSGAMLAGLQKVQQQARGAISTLNRDVSIKRADMYVQARQFTITNGVNAEQFMANYHSSFSERTLNALRMRIEKAGFDVKVWETEKGQAIKDAEFALDKWAKQTDAFLQIAKTQLSEVNSIVDSNMRVAALGVSASSTALDTYKSVITSANNAVSAIQTLAN
jgi:hypothetical protein